MRLQLLFLRQAFVWAASAAIALQGTAVLAAEQMVLKYQILQESISVRELTTLAETGEVSPTLEFYLGLAQKDPQEVRRVLVQPIKADPLLLDQVLNSSFGEVLLDQLGQVIHTPSGQADRQALRAAVILSANQDSQLSLIEVIQNYPTSEVHIEGDRLVEGYEKLSAISGLVQNLEGLLKGLL